MSKGKSIHIHKVSLLYLLTLLLLIISHCLTKINLTISYFSSFFFFCEDMAII